MNGLSKPVRDSEKSVNGGKKLPGDGETFLNGKEKDASGGPRRRGGRWHPGLYETVGISWKDFPSDGEPAAWHASQYGSLVENGVII
jgi:hypothetical protein